MDFMKVFDQTVREIKREVNLKVLKVPEIEQKVLDATDNEPWGPHGTALAEIAQATKKFTECQMVMNVLWTRLGETGKDWRYVYKALAVIEYLISHGSERAVDEIIEHTYQISSLTSFEYVEPNGKDVGINVRKKAENIVALLNNKEKIQETREKAASNRDKYVGLSSSGISYKSGSASYGGSYQSGSRNFDSYKDRDNREEEKNDFDSFRKSRQGVKSDEQSYNSKKSAPLYGSMDQDNLSGGTILPSKQQESGKYSGSPSNNDDDFDDFDPRGTSTNKPTTNSASQVDLFGANLIGDLLDAPIPGQTETSSISNDERSQEVDLFSDATFVSAFSSPQETRSGSPVQKEDDLFAASEPSVKVSSAPPTIDLFASPEPFAQPEAKILKPEPAITPGIVDPFAAVPLNSFDGSDPFGAFTSPLAAASTDTQKSTGPPSLADSKQQNPQKKDGFQVKSGIWADSLSRGLIDLNITAPKKVSLADVGVVGDLSNVSGEQQKAAAAAYYTTGWSMGAGSGLGRPGSYAPPQQAPDISDDFFSSLSSQQYQYGGFKQ
ncbi:PREDICTED: clathrin interactor EPSIN 1-like [Tarenaya hassleriana]|uniref:clathrin interactor EPSIN 1-like n=1 Tax=Tarenaya hassleriana TaxID=28532 RepID=UPI00053C3AEA|nr:PREDICTED: clathrin interactor EPSIN 1-like [Tarenaya hassleriana]